MNQGSVRSWTNPNGQTLVWLDGVDCKHCQDKLWCRKLCATLEDQLNMENSVQAILTKTT